MLLLLLEGHKRPQVALKPQLLLSSNKAYRHTFDQWPKLVPCLQYVYSIFAVKMSLFRTLVEIRSSHITWIKHYLGDQISFKYSRTRKKWEGVLMRIKVYLKFGCRSGPCLLSVGFLLTHWLLGLLWTRPVLLVYPDLPHWLMKTPLPLQKQA